MPTRGRPLTVHYYAWDADAQAPKTGDAANHALRVRTGSAAPAVPTNAPAEVDPTNLPGWYAVDLTEAETDGDTVLLAGKSSTAGVVVQGEQFGMEAPATSESPVYAVLTPGGLDAVLPITGVEPTVRLMDGNGGLLTSVNARQILAALFAVNCGDRNGIGTSTITTAVPGEDPTLTAVRVSRTAIQSAVVVPR